jgi:Leucine-rich repeat (LRR) protein/PKD repeat protein
MMPSYFYPRLIVIVLISFTIPYTALAQCSHPDYDALMALYSSTNGSQWSVNAGWEEGVDGTNCDPCTWYGIECDGDGRVSCIDMDGIADCGISADNGNNLTGTLPPEIGELTHLLRLELNGNSLDGAIPPELGNLTNLTRLYLSDNNFEGPIPSELGALSSLTILTLHNNNLSGNIPQDIGNLTDLVLLAMFGNELTGSIPSQLGNLQNLTRLYLFDNQLSGAIPPSLGNLTALTHLYLFENQLSGCFPDEMMTFCGLDFSLDINEEGYNFSDNPGLPWNGDFEQFCNGEDQIGAPCNDGDCSTDSTSIQANCECGGGVSVISSHPDFAALMELYNSTGGNNGAWINDDGWAEAAAGNSCDPCNWNGGTWYGLLCNENDRVWCIDLDGDVSCSNIFENDDMATGNGLIDTLPADWGGMSELIGLYLSHNTITGNIPDFTDLPTTRSIDLSSNQLSGNIPDFSDLPSIENLLFFSNGLSNSVPDFSNIPTLVDMVFFDNNLSGQIPDFSNLPNLQDMYLSTNQFTGSIPDFSGIPLLDTLFLHENNLQGAIPNFSGMPSLDLLILYDNQLTGAIPAFDNLPDLQYLLLHNNLLSGNIPSGLSNLSNLTRLYVFNNQLDGCFPDELSVFCNLGPSNNVNNPGYNFFGNPDLPWEGDFERFCDGDAQIGAFCDDGNPNTSGDAVQADCSCTGCGDFQITLPNAPLQACDEGSAQGVFNLGSLNDDLSNGGVYTVSWYEDIALNLPINNLGAFTSASTTVYALVSDGACDSGPLSIGLEVVSSPITNAEVITLTDNSCVGQPYQIQLAIEGGSPPYEISIQENGLPLSYNNVNNGDIIFREQSAPGTYSYFLSVITDNLGCETTIVNPLPFPGPDYPTVSVFESPNILPLADVVSCENYVLPAISGTNLSGQEAYYNQPGGQGVALLPGDVITSSTTLYAYDNQADCSDEEIINIQISLPETPSFSFANSFCETDGILILPNVSDNGISGSWNIDVLFDPAQYVGSSVSIIFTPDDLSCTSAYETTMTVNPIPDINSITPTAPTGPGQDDGTITVDAVGNNLEFSIDGGMNWQVSNTFTGLAPGAYEVLARELFVNACQNSVVIVVPEYVSPDIICPSIDCGSFNASFEPNGGPVFCTGDTIAFNNFSEPGFDLFIFDWGDGTIDTLMDYGNAAHQYNIPDSLLCGDTLILYNVNVQSIALCPEGSSCLSNTYFISIKPSPVAGFTAPSTVNAGEDVLPLDQSCLAENYDWDFGDGTGSTLANPSHIYNIAGTYIISQEVSNECGTDEFAQSITVNSTNEIIFYVDADGLSFNGDTLCIPINTLGFNAVTGFQLSLFYDAVLLDVTTDNLSSAFFSTFPVDANTSTLLWADDNGASLTLPDSSNLFTLKFAQPGNGQDCINIDFINSPLPILAVSDGGLQYLPITLGAEVCIPQLFYDVAGKIHTEELLSMPGVEVGNGIGGITITDANGYYGFDQLLAGNDYSITPFKDDNPLEGVNVADLVIIRDHILNTTLLGSPYKRIAADVDGSMIINLLDLLWIRDVVIGFEDHFPVNSWRFIPKDYPLPLPPSTVAVPSFVESLNLTPLLLDTLSADFIATKTGDVNATAESFSDTPIALSIKDQYIIAGKQYTISFDWETQLNIQGLQLEATFAPEKMDVLTGKSSPMDISGQMIHHKRDSETFRIVWLDGAEKRPVLQIIAKENGRLSDLMRFNNDAAPQNLAYAEGQLHPCQIYFTKHEADGVTIVYAGPNPFHNSFILKLNNSHTQKVRLEMYNIDGLNIYSENRILPSGPFDWVINTDSWKHKGLFYVKLTSEENTQIITLVRE